MARSSVFGRRIHIAGSIPDDLSVASTQNVDIARLFVEGLTKELTRRGATFVLPVDDDKRRSVDDRPICFDWLVWRTLHASLALRPAGAVEPLIVAVQHHKNEGQVPREFHSIWDDLRGSDRVQIENVSHWNMNSKRMEAQARAGDILLTLGGGEGVLFLANLYHDAGKPVVPVNFPIGPYGTGSLQLFDRGLSSSFAPRLFQSKGQPPHTWMNRINFTARVPVEQRIQQVIDLLENLASPRAFAVRLLDPKNPEFPDVQNHFDTIVRPVIEGDLGYNLTVVDGTGPYDQARIDQEIFSKLHRSSLVVVDITGMRPNCFLEFGYALGRPLPVVLMMKEGGSQPFDIATFACHRWTTAGGADARRQALREHYKAVRNRPPIVPVDPLIS